MYVDTYIFMVEFVLYGIINDSLNMATRRLKQF